MDPKLPQLDPKLKEAYERVMGTQNPPPPSPQPQPQQSPPSAPQPQENPAPPIPQDTRTQSVEKVFVNTSTTQAEGTKPKAKISPPLIIFAVIIFFAVYALVWIRVFNLKLPFLP